MRSTTVGTRLVLVLLAFPVLLACLAPAAGAQDTELGPRLVLVSIPSAHGPSDELDIRLRIVNRGDTELDGFRLTVGAGDIIRSRSELHSSFEAPTLFSSFPLDFPNLLVEPGDSETIRIDNPVAELTALSSEGGVHPLSLSLFSVDDSFTPLDTLTTQLMVYPSPPQEPLALVPLVVLDDAPARAPNGTFPGPEDEVNPLEEAVEANGWLRALASGLESATSPPTNPPDQPREGRRDRRNDRRPADRAPEPLRIGLAPTPRLVEELSIMSEGYVRSTDEGPQEIDEDDSAPTAAAEVLGTLRELVGRDGVQPVLVPYSFPDLPTLDKQLAAGDVGLQLTEAITVIDDALNVRLDRNWVSPPAGRLDAPSLESLQTAGVTDGVFLGSQSLEGPDDPSGAGCPIAVLSFTCVVEVETDVGGSIAGYAADVDLQRRMSELVGPGAGSLEIQRLLAETAMVHAEQPGTSGRILQLTISGNWRPRAGEAAQLFEALRDAPWLATATPAEGLEEADPPVERRLVEDVGPLPGTPDDGYFDAIRSAQEQVVSFSSFVGERGPRDVLERLRRNILVSEGRTLWEDGALTAAADYADDAREEAAGEMGKVTIGVPSQTTFTSRTGSLDISLFNKTGYPVNARVQLRALDMEFVPATIDDTFPPGTRRISIEAEAKTSGTFPIEVRVETPNGHLIANEAVQVRSTEFNVVALAITFGAVAFLILFYTVKALRRRRARHDSAEASAG